MHACHCLQLVSPPVLPLHCRCTSSAHAAAGASNATSKQGKPRPAPPPGKMPSQLTSSSNPTNISSSSNSKQSTKKLLTAQQLQLGAGSRGHSSSSTLKPASQQAAASLAAADAEVSAAAAALQAGRPAAGLAQGKPGTNASAAEQLLRSRKVPLKGSPRSNHSSSVSEAGVGSCSGNLSQYMLFQQLQVHGAARLPTRDDVAKTCGTSPGEGAAGGQQGTPGGSTANKLGPAQAALPQHAADLHYQQLLLQYSPPQSAAEILAAKAKSRRLRIQQRHLPGAPASLRGAAHQRPQSPPPVVLDGRLLAWQ